MSSLLQRLDDGSRALSYGLGALAITLAAAVSVGGLPLEAVLADGARILGGAFLLLFATLTLAALYCWVRLLRLPQFDPSAQPWLAGGLHAAAGIAALALTCTLLGISLGIGELAGRALTPDSVQMIIRELTARFSMAFATTILGLPTAALLRALLSITYAARHGGRAAEGS